MSKRFNFQQNNYVCVYYVLKQSNFPAPDLWVNFPVPDLRVDFPVPDLRVNFPAPDLRVTWISGSLGSPGNLDLLSNI